MNRARRQRLQPGATDGASSVCLEDCLAEARRVDAPDVVYAPVEKQYGNLFDVFLLQIGVVENRELLHRDGGGGCVACEIRDDRGHHFPRVVAQVTSRLTDEREDDRPWHVSSLERCRPSPCRPLSPRWQRHPRAKKKRQIG